MNQIRQVVSQAPVIHVPGPRLDAYAASILRARALATVSAEYGATVDLSEVDFIDSAGLGLLVALARRIKGNARLRLRGVTSRNVRTLLSITGLTSVFEIENLPAMAVAA